MIVKISHGTVSCQITMLCPSVAFLIIRAFGKCAYLFYVIYGGIYGNLISLLCLQKNKRLLVINFTSSDWTQQYYKCRWCKDCKRVNPLSLCSLVQDRVGRSVPEIETGFSSSLKFWHHLSRQHCMGKRGKGAWKPEDFQLTELDLFIPSDS